MKVLVQLISVLLIGANIALFIYIQIKQAQLLSAGIIFSYIFCPLGVIASMCAFIGAGKKKPELLLPLIILLSVFIIFALIATIGLICYYLFNEVKGHEGVILALSYETITIPVSTSLAVGFGSIVIAALILVITYFLYKSFQREIQRKIMAAESRPLSTRTVLSTDM